MYDAASRRPSLTGPWTKAKEVKTESERETTLQGPRALAERERASRGGQGGRSTSLCRDAAVALGTHSQAAAQSKNSPEGGGRAGERKVVAASRALGSPLHTRHAHAHTSTHVSSSPRVPVPIPR
ncbi:unnamed protein product [Natator depressus]